MDKSRAHNEKGVDCKRCSLAGQCRDSAVSWFFFFIAIIAAIAVRLVNIVLHLSEAWAKALWYIGVVGFAIYFLYKFGQEMKVKKYIAKTGIDDKLIRKEALSDQDYGIIFSLLCGLRSKKEAINYFFIFFTSAIALVLGVYQDFFAK